MNKLHILADENIPGLDQLCTDWATITRRPGREICSADLAGIDILFVRSVTSVSSELLGGSNVRFVGSATIGVDHLDIDYLLKKGIAYAHAPGCNANSVVDYVMSCIFNTFNLTDLSKQTVGIVGAGNVGSRLAKCLNYFGINFLIYDPFVQLNIPQEVAHFEDILQATIISLHVPLTVNGDHPTWHLLDGRVQQKLTDNCLLINTSRGAVIDNEALLSNINKGQSLTLAIDVWESEPNILWDLCRLAAISTPHIAGYSYPGKMRGTQKVVLAAQRFFQQEESVFDGPCLPQVTDFNSLQNYHLALHSIYDVSKDHRSFKHHVDSSISPAECFDQFRKNYPRRDEIIYDN